MRAIFCGNFEYDARQSDLERLFRKYGKVDRVDMKAGFAFIYMVDERDAEDAIHGLDRIEFGRKGRRLRVEWTKQGRGSGRESLKKSSSSSRPSKTLFVINFDPYHTRTRDLEKHFDPYGKILNVRIRRNFAFIQYETQEDASRALDATNLSKLLDRVITVEYAMKDDDERGGHSPDRARGRSPRRGYERARSPALHGRERGSPDYGHGQGHTRSPRRERASPDYDQGPSPVRNGRERNSDHGSGRHASPRREKVSLKSHGYDSSPRRERRSSENNRKTSPREQASPPHYRRRSSSSPRRERRERLSPDNGNSASPDSNPEVTNSPGYDGAESPLPERLRSRSAPPRERQS
ncbi:OLC1v1027340C1 [Oldenlandia corymbosa var. corymbosa]|uniref:OLC1v1027340C1 n=1 Tax=Oldenlandia corymbosa var. corymbosa TaxID=529605 RepID=A0AAV1CCH6_OLDCO|nr:OLC1v1027340C1 [Oldenlandia corymbosa var. corymbosa]